MVPTLEGRTCLAYSVSHFPSCSGLGHQQRWTICLFSFFSIDKIVHQPLGLPHLDNQQPDSFCLFRMLFGYILLGHLMQQSILYNSPANVPYYAIIVSNSPYAWQFVLKKYYFCLKHLLSNEYYCVEEACFFFYKKVGFFFLHAQKELGNIHSLVCNFTWSVKIVCICSVQPNPIVHCTCPVARNCFV